MTALPRGPDFHSVALGVFRGGPEGHWDMAKNSCGYVGKNIKTWSGSLCERNSSHRNNCQ